MNTQDTIVEIIAREMKLSIDNITSQTKLNDLGVDSLKAIIILSELEDFFKIEIPNEALDGLDTVGDIVSRVEALQKTKNA